MKTILEMVRGKLASFARLTRLSCLVCLICQCALAATAGELAAETNSVTRPQQNFDEARNRFQSETNFAEVAWQFGRACFDLADLATNDTRKAELAEQGISACRAAITNDPACAPAHCYLGMTIGQLADTKRNLAALRMVKEMEHEFKRAAELDETFDFAGPDRNLGLLYAEAPSVVSVGSRSKARQHLRRAVELAPGYPENQLNLIEAYLKWGDTADAQSSLKTLEESWTESQKQFADRQWESSWRDWQSRLDKVKQKLEPPKSKHGH